MVTSGQYFVKASQARIGHQFPDCEITTPLMLLTLSPLCYKKTISNVELS